jgi:apolipoprotein D and lipocalin family protein
MMPTAPSATVSEVAAAAGDLDARIRAAELRIVERDEQFRSQVHELLQQTRQSLSPSRLKLPLIGVATSLAALWWAGSRRRAAAPALHMGAAPHAARSHSVVPWTQLLALAWPMVPARWRERISPGTAAALASVALPLLGRVLGADARPPLVTMAYVDLRRYAGRWFELARLPAPFEGACTGLPTATYVPRGGKVGVINRCLDRRGRLRESRGAARVVPGSGNARLEVSLWPRVLRWLPMGWAEYWILHVDDDYRVALVGHPNRRFLWILSREPELPASQMQALLTMAAERGFAVDRLHFNTR